MHRARWNVPTWTLKAGTPLYHGTSDAEFDPVSDGIEAGFWVSDSEQVARRFAQNLGATLPRRGSGDPPVVHVFVLTRDVALPSISSASAMRAFSEDHDLDRSGVEGIRESMTAAGLPGWIIPSNYPEGADILLMDADEVLSYSHTLGEPALSSDEAVEEEHTDAALRQRPGQE